MMEDLRLEAGSTAIIAPAGCVLKSQAPAALPVVGMDRWEGLRVGRYLVLKDSPPLAGLEQAVWMPDESGVSRLCWRIRLAAAAWISDLNASLPVKKGFSLAWITLSDKGARGERIDSSGPAIEAAMQEALPISFAARFVIPDSKDMLRSLLLDLALTQGFDFIFTTGGTGVGPRDTTPEATQPLLDKRLPGFEQAMMQASLSKTPHAAISRAVAGTLGESLVLNLPGSPKAVRENLAAVIPAARHAVEKLQGDESDCAVQ